MLTYQPKSSAPEFQASADWFAVQSSSRLKNK